MNAQMIPGTRVVQFALAAGLALNAALWLCQDELAKGTGKVAIDGPKYFWIGCLAAAAIAPGVVVWRKGTAWQKVVACVFLALPVWNLFFIGQWAVEHW